VTQDVAQDGSNTCSSDTDCPFGDFCFVNSCIGNVCVSPTYECANPNNAKMLFRRVRRGTVYNALLGIDVTISSS
jgi:hypothetical protein